MDHSGSFAGFLEVFFGRLMVKGRSSLLLDKGSGTGWCKITYF